MSERWVEKKLDPFRPPTGQGLRAFLVAVDYNDLLQITLPYNRHHFDSVHVITAIGRTDAEREGNTRTVEIAQENQCHVTCTDAFYRDGAKFNKWAALEEELSMRGRYGWICLMDADVLWPRNIDLWRYLRPGYLYTPFRLIMDPPPRPAEGIPSEAEWARRFPMHRQQHEFAGYTQIFNCADPVLGNAPWHEVNWTHAGGADSFFQAKWPAERKVRPPFRVLHLGPSGVNWLGRASAYTDGSAPEGGMEKMGTLRKMLLERRRGEPDPYAHERIPTLPTE